MLKNKYNAYPCESFDLYGKTDLLIELNVICVTEEFNIMLAAPTPV